MKSAIQNPKSALRLRSGQAIQNAFTLVEVLVIIAIILLLAGILIPALDMIRQNVKVQLTQSNINLISTACELFKNDHDVYPPSTDTKNDYFSGSNITGAEILALLLTGYANDSISPKGKPEKPMIDDDGRDGFGFRTVQRGIIYGPYNGTEKIPTSELIGHPVFADAFGNPILYYQRDGLNLNFNDTHNPTGPGENYVSYNGKDYWGDWNQKDDGGINTTSRLIFILSPGKDEDWSENGKDEDDIVNQ